MIDHAGVERSARVHKWGGTWTTQLPSRIASRSRADVPPESLTDDAVTLGQLLRMGLERVASIIDGNENYDDILRDRLKPYESLETIEGKVEWTDAFALIKARLVRKAKKIFLLPKDEQMVFYASTANNRRELDFFTRTLSRNGHDYSIVNVCDCEPVMRKIEADGRMAVLEDALEKFLRARGRVSKSILHQSLNYAIASLGALETMGATGARIFGVANDHSPEPTAYLIAAIHYGLKTVYVQHAEVTSIFPPNIFDYSLLRNHVSKETYNGISPLRGEAIVLPRAAQRLDLDQLHARRTALTNAHAPNVVVYPSSVFSTDVLASLVSRLNNNPFAGAICIKPHPGLRSYEDLAKTGADIVTEIPNDPHVAICGNSSVVVELLVQGNLVYQLFALDPIPPDYYGFVKRGLACELDLEQCQTDFWRTADLNRDFPARLGQFVPQVETRANRLEREKLAVFLRKLTRDAGISGKYDYEHMKEFFFRRDLFVFSGTFFRYVRTKGNPYGGDFWSLKRLESYFRDRDPSLGLLYPVADARTCESVIDFWLITKRIEWAGLRPSERDLETLSEFVGRFEGERKARAWMEAKLFDVLLRHSGAKVLSEFLEHCRVFSIERTSINKRVSFVRYIEAMPEERGFLRRYYDYRHSELSPLERLKIIVQCGLEQSGGETYPDYRAIEREFIRCTRPELSKDYRRHVVSVCRGLRGRAVYMDVKRNPLQANRFLRLITKHLQDGTGFSFIRLSDGEGYLFQEYSAHFSREDARNRERHWWGQELPIDISRELISVSIDAVKNATVLGIPSVYRFLRDHTERSVSLGGYIQGRGLLSVLAGVKTLDQGRALFTDDKANIALFGRLDVLRSLSEYARSVLIVASAAPGELRRVVGRGIEYRHVQIPTHYKTTTNDKYVSAGPPLPFVYQEICKEIERSTGHGDLVLVAAGVAGKVFMEAARRRGGVALDLGSALDQLLDARLHSLF